MVCIANTNYWCQASFGSVSFIVALSPSSYREEGTIEIGCEYKVQPTFCLDQLERVHDFGIWREEP